MNICRTIGILNFLEEQNNDIVKNAKIFVGSSAGSIIAFLLSLHFSSNFIKNIFTLIEDKTDLFTINVDKIMNFLNTFGIYDNSFILNIITMVAKKKIASFNENTTFAELYEFVNNRNKLVITGTCVETMSTEVFSVDNTPNMSVLLAINISISIPFLMKPVWYNNYRYVDGSLLCNCYFDFLNNNDFQKDITTEKIKILIINLDSTKKKHVILTLKERKNEPLYQYAFQIIKSICIHNQETKKALCLLKIHDQKNLMIDLIEPPLFISEMIEFKLSKENKKKLFSQGYLFAKEFKFNIINNK